MPPVATQINELNENHESRAKKSRQEAYANDELVERARLVQVDVGGRVVDEPVVALEPGDARRRIAEYFALEHGRLALCSLFQFEYINNE